jgi:protein TonB
VRDTTLSIPLLLSSLIHAAVILVISAVISQSGTLLQKDLIPIGFIDMPSAEREPPVQREVSPSEAKKPPLPPRQVEKAIVQPQRPAPPPTALPREVPAKPIETKPDVIAKPESTAPFSSPTPIESGGSEVGAGNLFGNGDVAVMPGSGTAGGGGGTANAGLGRGSGTPGLPTQTTVLKTNREAKPIETVRAAYPPLALRMGMESNVTIRIDVDSEGKVTKAEIIKSGGIGFDEEALKAVNQSRFEPSQKDGKNVPAEFTYIYHFRLTK